MSQRTIVWVAIFTVIALMFWRLPQLVAEQDAVYRTYGVLLEADALIRQKYVHDVDDERLVEGAVRGMLRRLDPYCAYITPQQRDWLRRRTRGEYVGVGVEVAKRNGAWTVISPIEDGPADRAGVMPGDAIVAVDGRDVESMSVLDIDRMFAGSAGSEVTLTIRRDGEEPTRRVAIRRGPVSITTVRGSGKTDDGRWNFMVDPDDRLGYIRVSDFSEITVRDFDAALKLLTQAGVRGLIIDLRDNPGGLMHEAIRMVDRFVAGGPILATVTRRKVVQRYQASPDDTIEDIPLVVLVNGGSASSSEIVAGSLQARGRAVVVGQRTFGKGSVQHLITLSDAVSAIKLTVAYYQLPNGRFIHRTPSNKKTDEWGVTPDVIVDAGDGERPKTGPTAEIPDDRQLAVALEDLRKRTTTATVPGE